jgi:hypothetical protein
MYASGQGRWLSPDPLMGHPFNPQTFDRYGYALGNPARFTDPTGQDPVYCEFVTIGGEFAGGGCDYTAGSNDYLNPYQEYVYNCMVYPAGCGYYNGMPVPNYPAYGGGGYTPPSQPPTNISVRTTAPPNPPTNSLMCSMNSDLGKLLGVEEALEPFEARIIPAIGMITSGLGVAATAVVTMGAAPLSIPVAVPVLLGGTGLALEGGYYAATGRMYAPGMCH